MWTTPGSQEVEQRCDSKRLRSYVRSVHAATSDRCQDGGPRREFRTCQRIGCPTNGSHGLSRVLDRSITPSVVLEQASASALGEASPQHRLNWGCRHQISRRSWMGLLYGWSGHRFVSTDGSFRERRAQPSSRLAFRSPPVAARSGLDEASTALHCGSEERRGAAPHPRCSVRR